MTDRGTFWQQIKAKVGTTNDKFVLVFRLLSVFPLLNIYKVFSFPLSSPHPLAWLIPLCCCLVTFIVGVIWAADVVCCLILSCPVLPSFCLRLFAAALGPGNRLASWAQPQIALGLGLAVAAARGSSQCHLQAATWRKLLVTLDTRLLEPRAAATFFCRRYALFVQLLD